MKRVTYYEVRSDNDDGFAEAVFSGQGSKQKAISYAKQLLKTKSAWVDKIIYDAVKVSYEYCGSVWSK